MEHVLWIGGPPGAGKSTAARRFAHRHGLRFYGVDLHTYDHGARLGFEPGTRPAAASGRFKHCQE